MSDLNQDPYAGASSDEEREAIYQNLLAQHEQAVAQYEKAEYERRKIIYSDYMADWKYQRDIQRNLDQRGHKSLLTIAAGSFGISFAFISQIVKLDIAKNIPILVTSWAFFALTIVLSILELKVGALIQDKILDNIEKNLERGYKNEPHLYPNRILLMWPSRILSWISVGTFITGVSCLIFFVHQNM